MRILIDAHLSENRVTGIGRYLNKLIATIIKLDSSNEYFIIHNKEIESNHSIKCLSASNLSLIPTNFSGLSFQLHWELSKIIQEYKIDIYHHPHFDLPISCSVPAVITIHDLKYLRHPHYFSDLGSLKRFYIYYVTKMAMKRSQKIISVSESTKNDIVGMFGTDSDKIKTIYHGVEIDNNTDNGTHDYLQDNGINKPYILFVGERRPHKNLMRLIEAFEELTIKLNEEIQLVIVGKKYKNYDLPERTVKQKKLENKVLLLGNINDKNLSRLYKNSLLFILPSLYEGFGFPVIEAMTLGSPVIGSNTSSLPELIGDAGVQINPMVSKDMTRSMKELIENKSLRKRLSMLGRQQAQKFTWENSAKATIEVYQEIFK